MAASRSEQPKSAVFINLKTVDVAEVEKLLEKAAQKNNWATVCDYHKAVNEAFVRNQIKLQYIIINSLSGSLRKIRLSSTCARSTSPFPWSRMKLPLRKCERRVTCFLFTFTTQKLSRIFKKKQRKSSRFHWCLAKRQKKLPKG